MIFLENSSQNARNVALETLNRVVEAEYFYLNIQALFNIPTFNIPEIPGVCENIIRILFQVFIFLLLIFIFLHKYSCSYTDST